MNDEKANPYRFSQSIASMLLQTQQPLEASRVIRRMIAMRPDEVEPYYMLARAFLGMEQYESAEKMLATALSKDPRYAPAHALHGVLLDTVGRSNEAENSHRRAVALAPKDASYRNNLGFNLYLRGQYPRAIKAYRAGLELDPAARRIHNNLGFAYGRVGELDLAEKSFKFAGPPAQASCNIGFIYEQRGNDEAAYQSFLVAVTQDPLLVPALDSLRRTAEKLGRPLPELPKPVRVSEPQEPTALMPSEPPAGPETDGPSGPVEQAQESL